MLVISRDTDVLLLLVHFMPTKPVEVWMISGTPKSRKCYPVHEASQRLPQSVKTNLLSFHALTGCDTTSAFHGYGKKSCWKTFLNQPLLVALIGRDGELAPIEQFVCHLYGRIKESSVDQARLQFLARPRRVWRCYPQLRMHWNFTRYVPTTRQRSGCKQTSTSNTYRPHLQWTPRPGSRKKVACKQSGQGYHRFRMSAWSL